MLILAGAAALIAATLPLLAGDRAAAKAFASRSVEAEGPTVALLATKIGAEHTSLYFVQAGGGEAHAPVATFSHLAGAVVKASVVPGTQTVVATADTRPTRDASFNASLFRLAPHAPPERLCDDVVHASRPLVTPQGRVFVSRGAPGAEPNDESAAGMRVDALSVDEIDPGTGALRTIHTYSGYLTFLAAAAGNEVLLYRVGPGGADIVAVDADTGAARTVMASLPPFARDFSVDVERGALVFQGRHEAESRTWVIDRIDLASGARVRLLESASMSMGPHVWPGGAVAYNPPEQGGLAILGGGSGVRAPLGAGVDFVSATSTDGRWVAALHTVPGTLPVPFAMDAETGRAAALHAPPGTSVAIAGFTSGEEASR